MNPGTGLVLYVVVLAVLAYALYWIVRKAVAHGIRDARRAEAREAAPQEADRIG